jgi:RNA recognition motif-containing protein
MNIYVGNLDGDVTEDVIRGLFAPFGEVGKVTLLRDRRGISKGFGFVEMPSANQGSEAIEKLNRTLLLDRTLDISESAPPAGKGGRNKVKPRPSRPKR